MTQKYTRREFIKLSGLTAAAAAVLTGCGPASRYVVRRPYTDMPEYQQTGLSTYFATTCRECPAGCGLIVRTHEGRAIKVEGNPAHPVNRGKVCSRGLTAVQGLYNPDRITGPLQNGSEISWDQAVAQVSEALKADPQGVAFFLGLAPDHLFDLVSELTAALGAPPPVRYGAYGMFDARRTLTEAAKLTFGVPSMPFFDLGESDFILSFGANFLETWVSPLAYARGLSQMRRGKNNARGRLVVIEPRQSVTSGTADLWLAPAPGTEALAAAALANLVAARLGLSLPDDLASVDPKEAAAAAGIAFEKLQEVAAGFASARAPLALPGGGALAHTNGLAAARAVLALNALVKNLGKPGGVFLTPADPAASSFADVQALVARMNAGQIHTLFIHGVNPVFELPAALGFAAALKKVPQVVSFASFPDETAALSTLVLPDHTLLESWGYQRTLAGADREAYSAAQPVVVPLHNTRAAADVLLSAARQLPTLAAALPYADEVEFLQARLLPLLESRKGFYDAPEILTFWSQWLQYGGWWPQRAGLEAPIVAELYAAAAPLTPPAPLASGELHFYTYPTQLGDGSGANRPWLQETPDPMTTVMWNSWVEIHPETAAKLGIHDDDVVKIVSASGEIEAVAYLYPAIRPDTVAVPFGQGHSALGRYAEGRGANPAALLPLSVNESGDLSFGDTRVSVQPTGQRRPLSRMENRHGVYDHAE